jgi:hypothetical protein
MMLPTHAVIGLAIAAPLLALSPDHATAVLVGALVGSVLPDLDLYAGHRRSLHYPTVYALAAVPAVGGAALLGTPLAVALAAVLVGAALHCRMDRYGGGLELRPWEATSERAVYDHVQGEWRTPKRWIRYDGSTRDVSLLVLLGVPLAVVLDAPFRWIVVVALLVGVTYGLLRRRLAALAPAVFEQVPESVTGYVPERYRR